MNPFDFLDSKDNDLKDISILSSEIPGKPIIFNKKAYIPKGLRWKVWERDNFTCKKCGKRQDLSIDHIIPESKGGGMEEDNLQTLCFSCNAKKYNNV
jgi:5-methylcytosine-specific restriction endonuclease McrA